MTRSAVGMGRWWLLVWRALPVRGANPGKVGVDGRQWAVEPRCDLCGREACGCEPAYVRPAVDHRRPALPAVGREGGRSWSLVCLRGTVGGPLSFIGGVRGAEIIGRVGAGSVEDLRDALTSEREPLADLSEREAVRAQRDDLPVAR